MSILRIGGIVSGFDTEQIVRDLMRIEQVKTNRLIQQKEVKNWQKEQYRDIINSVRRFRDDFFNIAQPETNLLSLSTLKKLTATSSNPTVSVSASANALIGSSTFKVLKSATAAKAAASQVSTDSLNLSDTMEEVSGKLQSATKMNFGADGHFTLKINNAEITISNTDTLASVLNRINASSAQLRTHYSAFSDTFTFTAKNTGAGNITTDDNGNFFTALGLIPVEGKIGAGGRDAEFQINGFYGTSSSNAFTIDGISYNITAEVNEPTEVINISTSSDITGVYDTIEKFVDAYNSLIASINGKLTEERFKDFLPLTEEQRNTMSDSEIEKWEIKAQSGLLRGDSSLEQMLRDLRKTLYDMVGDFHLTQIGIETSSNFRDNGKLVLKDGGSVLRQAIAANPDKVAELFARRSHIAYSPNLTAAQIAQRFAESGISHRLSDILNNNIRTTRSTTGQKGILLEKAGIEGDISEFNNFIDRQISEISKRLDRMNEILIRKENQYFRQFAAMEKSLQQLTSQGDWLMMQLNQGR